MSATYDTAAMLSRSCEQMECARCYEGDTWICQCFCHDQPAPLTDTRPSRTELAITTLLDVYGFSPKARREAEARVMQVLIEAAVQSQCERERMDPTRVLAALRGEVG